MTLGERIQFLRKQRGLTQEDLATKLNLSRHAVAKWEQDVCEPNVESFRQMSEIFDVDLHFLMTGEHSSLAITPLPDTAQKPKFFDKVKKIFAIAEHYLPFALALVSTVFIFLIGYSSIAVSSNTSTWSEGKTIFYFFVEISNDLSSLSTDFMLNQGRAYTLFVNAGICAFILAACFVATCVFSVISTIKNARALIKKENPNHTFSMLAGTAYFLAVLMYINFVLARIYMQNKYNVTLGLSRPNAATIVGIIFVCLLVAWSIACNVYRAIKEKRLNIKPYICGASCFVVAIILTILIGSCGIDIYIPALPSGHAKLSFPLWQLPKSLYSADNEYDLGVLNEVCTVIIFALFVVLAIVAIVSLIKKGAYATTFKPFDKKIITLDVCTVILSVIFLVLYILVVGEYAPLYSDSYSVDLTFPITILVFAVLSLIATIVFLKLNADSQPKNDKMGQPLSTDEKQTLLVADDTNIQSPDQTSDQTGNETTTQPKMTDEEFEKRIAPVKNIALPVLNFACAFIPLLFTFLMGANVVRTKYFDFPYTLNVNTSIFNYLSYSTYLGDAIRLAQIFASNEFFASASIYVWIEFALSLICVIGAVVVVPLLSLIAIIKNTFSLVKKKQYKSLDKEVYASIYVYISSVLLFGFLNNTTSLPNGMSRLWTLNNATIVGIVLCLFALLFKKGCNRVFAIDNFNGMKFALSSFKSYFGLFVAFVLTAFTLNLYYKDASALSVLSPTSFYYYTYSDYINNASLGTINPLAWSIGFSSFLLIVATVLTVGALALFIVKFAWQPKTSNKFIRFLHDYAPSIMLLSAVILYWLFLSYFCYDAFSQLNVALPWDNYSLHFIILLVPLAIFDLVFTSKINKKLKKLNN